MVKKFSKLIFLLKSHTFFSYFFYKLGLNKTYLDNNFLTENKRFKHLFNYKFDCSNPRTFNEWLCFLKFSYNSDLWCQCADKLGSKEFLKKIHLEEYLPKLYGVYSHIEEIDLDLLPNEFVLKTNNDCGSVFICNKNTSDFKEIFSKLQCALGKDYSRKNNEWVYKKIQPKIFAEELLIPRDNLELIDYKFQIIDGKFAFGYSLENKNVDERYYLFDRNYNKMNSLYQSLSPKNNPKKPDDFEKMVELAEKIGKSFMEVRVDMFATTNGIKIGELTFFTQSGHGVFSNRKIDFQFGECFRKSFEKWTK